MSSVLPQFLPYPYAVMQRVVVGLAMVASARAHRQQWLLQVVDDAAAEVG